MEGDAALVPLAHDREAVGAVSKEAIELVGDDGANASVAHTFEDAPSSFARSKRLPGANSGIDDQLGELEATHGAVR